MDKKFMEENRNNVTFNLDEILRQTCHSYDYNLEKKYSERDRDADPKDQSTIEKKKAKKEYTRKLRNHCDTEKEKVRLVLRSMNIDLDEYKANKRYQIPFVIAELIYVISREGSYTDSTISKLKTNKIEDIRKEEKLTLTIKTFEEIKKDCYDNDYIINECNEILDIYNYILHLLTVDLQAIEERINDIKRRVYVPIISYDKFFQTVLGNFYKVKPDHWKSETELGIAILSCSTNIVCSAAEFDGAISNINRDIDKLEDQMTLLLRA